jgi:2-polyprenyl-6-methoxyphenol hydroxylase-like FAD-dependent oxidoreductase
MPHIVVVGGGLIGLATALLVAKQGHDVTVLERDPEPPPTTPGEANGGWDRPGVMQFRLVNFLMPRGRQLLDEHLPEVPALLASAGAHRYNGLVNMPSTITDRAPRPGDERFATLATRRPLLEYAMATATAAAVDVRRGVRVAGLLSDGHRRVTGVQLHGAGEHGAEQHGGELAADLVIDAMGRRSPLPAWLAAIGAIAPAEQSEDLGFVYYGRFFQAPPGPPPLLAAGLWHYDSYSVLVVPSDAGTWCATVVTSARDHALRPLREEANFTKLLRACPGHARILDLEPITGMLAAAGTADRLRQLVICTAPIATGVITVGDSWACTNPSLGRGISLGLMHAVATAEAVGSHLADPVALALEHDRLTRKRVLPWYRATTQLDRHRAAQVAAVVEARAPAPGPASPAARAMADFMTAMPLDPDIFRAFLEMTYVLALPEEILARPGFAERVREVAGDRTPSPPPGPSRSDLLAML